MTVADIVAALSPPLEQWRRFRYVDRLVDGHLLGEVDHFPGVLQPASFVRRSLLGCTMV